MSSYLDRIIRFVEVAEQGSITRAAANLGVDQPWLSRQIAQLEKMLGFSLLERTPRGVALTPDGQTLLHSAAALARAAERVKTDTERLRRGQTTLLVGVPNYVYWIPARKALLDTFRRRNPSVTLTLVSEKVPRMATGIASGSLDVGFVGLPPTESNFDFLPLHASAPAMIIPREDPLADKAEIRVADLKGRKLAMLPDAQLASLLYGAFFNAGMIPREIPEGRMAMGHYAEIERLCLLALNNVTPEVPVPDSMVFKQVVDAPRAVIMGLIRSANDTRPAVERFWRIARELSPPDFVRPDESQTS